MKITFEGQFFSDIVEQMRAMVEGLTPPKNISQRVSAPDKNPAAPTQLGVGSPPQGPGPEDPFGQEAVDKPVEKPVDKPKPKIDRVAAMNKAREAKNAKAKAAATAPPEEPAPAPKAAAKALDPAQVAKMRQDTIAELQAAYANGLQAEVFELLSRFGNGAKSFRELPADAFGPIREAIDNGALTQ